MGYVIIDLEFNNMRSITKYLPNIYEENTELLDVGLDNEIIEIGAIRLDKMMNKVGELRRYIKPTAFKVINPKITEITGINQSDLEKGISFEEAMDELKAFVKEGDVICSWAKDDIAEIVKNSIYHNYGDYEWIKGIEYLDIQAYVTKVLGHKKSMSLKSALEELKIKLDEGKLHDALNDSIYTAEVFKRLFNGRIVRQYLIKDIYSMPAILVKDLQNYHIDEEHVDFKCPKCSSSIDAEKPYKLFSWRFMSIGVCPRCKTKVLQEIIIKRTLGGEEIFDNIRTILNEREYLDYYYKFEKASS